MDNLTIAHRIIVLSSLSVALLASKGANAITFNRDTVLNNIKTEFDSYAERSIEQVDDFQAIAEQATQETNKVEIFFSQDTILETVINSQTPANREENSFALFDNLINSLQNLNLDFQAGGEEEFIVLEQTQASDIFLDLYDNRITPSEERENIAQASEESTVITAVEDRNSYPNFINSGNRFRSPGSRQRTNRRNRYNYSARAYNFGSETLNKSLLSFVSKDISRLNQRIVLSSNEKLLTTESQLSNLLSRTSSSSLSKNGNSNINVSAAISRSSRGRSSVKDNYNFNYSISNRAAKISSNYNINRSPLQADLDRQQQRINALTKRRNEQVKRQVQRNVERQARRRKQLQEQQARRRQQQIEQQRRRQQQYQRRLAQKIIQQNRRLVNSQR